MKGTIHKLYISLFFLIGILSLTLLTVNGFSYYSLPIEQRVFSAHHLSLKPSGVIGHGLGILGSLMMIVGVSTYMIRKRFRMFFHWGYLKYWLEFHIFLCTVGPLFVLYHTAFKFGGIVAVSFWSQPHPDRMMADAEHLLEFLEGGVGMLFNVDLEFLRVEFAPMTPACFGGQRPGLYSGQIAVNGAPPQFKAPGGLDFGAPRPHEFHYPFPQVQGICFHAPKPFT